MLALISVLVLIIGLIVLIILARIQQRKKEEERTQALQKMAEQLGWSFESEASVDSIPGLDGFGLYDRGYDRQIRNLMYREGDDFNTTVFDYIYTSGTGKHQTTYFQSVAHFDLPEQSFPDFGLRPEGVFDKVFSAFGYQDIDFGQRPEFSRQYILRGEGEAAIRQTFSDRLLLFFENHPDWFIDTVDSRLFLYRMHNRLPPEEIESFVDLGEQILALMRR